MNKLLSVILFAIVLNTSGNAQTKRYVGLGYFGESLTHLGFTAEYEQDMYTSNKISFPLKGAIGFYVHPRNHNGAFITAKGGVRWHASNRFHIGLNAGIGPMFSWYNSDLGVFEVDDSGNHTEVRNFAGIDLMPSIDILDIGFRISKYQNRKSQYAWIRPTIFWQMLVNGKMLRHTALQIGYSIDLF